MIKILTVHNYPRSCLCRNALLLKGTPLKPSLLGSDAVFLFLHHMGNIAILLEIVDNRGPALEQVPKKVLQVADQFSQVKCE